MSENHQTKMTCGGVYGKLILLTWKKGFCVESDPIKIHSP